MLFNIIFRNEIHIKAQVQIVQNIQIWLPMKNNRWGEKNHIQENTKGKNMKEGHMIRNCRILLLKHSFSVSCKEDKLMPGHRGFDTVLFLRRRNTDNQRH